MSTELFEELFNLWKLKELKHQNDNKRKYLHFDLYIGIEKNINSLKSFLCNAQTNVQKHSFYPFIKSNIVTPRLKREKDPITKKQTLHKVTKERPICYSSHFDSFIYSWYSTILTYFYKQKLIALKIENCVLAYLEKNKQCNIDFAKEVFEHIKKTHEASGDCVAIAFDLKSFFDGIDHEILKEKWCKVWNEKEVRLPKDHFAVYKSLTNYSYVEKADLIKAFPSSFDSETKTNRICTPPQFRTSVKEKELIKQNPFTNQLAESAKQGVKCGIPQGSTISACLSNIYMIDFDSKINNEAIKRDALYRRYSDDLILICKKEDWKYYFDLMTNSIRNCEIKMNDDKTEIIFFSKNTKGKLRGFNKDNDKQYANLQYLGFEFNGQNTYIRSSSMSRYAQRMSRQVDKCLEDAYDEESSHKDIIFRKKLHRRFTPKGSRNFISYAKRAIKKNDSSKTINKQVKHSFKKIEKLIKVKKTKLENDLKTNGKFTKTMK